MPTMAPGLLCSRRVRRPSRYHTSPRSPWPRGSRSPSGFACHRGVRSKTSELATDHTIPSLGSGVGSAIGGVSAFQGSSRPCRWPDVRPARTRSLHCSGSPRATASPPSRPSRRPAPAGRLVRAWALICRYAISPLPFGSARLRRFGVVRPAWMSDQRWEFEPRTCGSQQPRADLDRCGALSSSSRHMPRGFKQPDSPATAPGDGGDGSSTFYFIVVF